MSNDTDAERQLVVTSLVGVIARLARSRPLLRLTSASLTQKN
jgi:hypothetical protein